MALPTLGGAPGSPPTLPGGQMVAPGIGACHLAAHLAGRVCGAATGGVPGRLYVSLDGRGRAGYVGIMARLARGGFRRFGVTFGRCVRWAIGGFVAGLEKSLGRPLHRRRAPVRRPAANANGDKYCLPGTPGTPRNSAAVAPVALRAPSATAAGTLPMAAVPPYSTLETVQRMGTS